MGSQGFSFPPPPPPPPPTQQPTAYPPTQHGHNWGGRGGAQRGRGRGQGHRGRGGHAEGGRTPSYPAPGGFNYAQTNYAGYPSQPVHAAPYMPPAPYPHGQSQGYQNPQGASTFPNAPFPQPVAATSYQHLPYNAPANQAAPYHSTPPYMQGLPTPHHSHQSNSQAMMGAMPWGSDMHGQYMGAQPGQARGPRPHAHGNYGSKPKPNQKRDHASAFTKPQSTVPRPAAAPAVPSFGNPLPSKPPPAADATGNRKTKKRKRKHNQLGLTPNADDHESSEEDEAEGADEESKLAQNGSNAEALQVSYKGKTSTLKTPSEIAAWIAERKKNYPTQARVAEKKKAAEEAKASREAARQKTQEQQQAQWKEGRKQSEKTPNAPSDSGADPDTKRREEIRRNLEREQERIAKAVAEADAARLRLEALQKEALSLNTECIKEEDQTVKDEPITDSHDNIAALNIKTEPADNDEPQEATSSSEPSAPASWVKKEPECVLEAPEVPASAPFGAPTPHDMKAVNELSNQGSDWTSSDGSDSDSEAHSDSDSAPEQASSRRTGPERVPPPPRQSKVKSICRYFSSGKCRKGDQCTFLHDTAEGGPKAKPEKKAEKETRRKGLYQAVSVPKTVLKSH
ncbi:unnamed protein product [Penicillium salamii]|uniref:C3H1-type domain-containing protein n=1 Tax=Penicillium salamii TaxID=1612424 RepID=A0A9W4N6S8_9EURO|nr:unnamed protein product [Penicillium salamii]CAG8107346.1 unnamed protein product [Penicillium salamii]CAG8282241.1 unnamed protein product [Penicillium salamii]CAG8300630.1 unnamed protein product [Penicillium salamii]CAG8385718.1 unnamed protein product [Penicillium salamii]